MLRRILSSLILVYGLALSVAGAGLVMAGGSAAFLLSGLGTAVSGGLFLFRRFSSTVVVYTVTLLATAIWSLHEVGPDLVQLAPRLLIGTVIGLCLLPAACVSRTPKRTTA